MNWEPGYMPGGIITVNISPVGARTLSCWPGPAPGGTVTAKWPSIMKRAWLSGQLLKRAWQQFVLGPHELDLGWKCSRSGAERLDGPFTVLNLQGVGLDA